ncbi:hypothetical protein CEUSTIGMA_g2175.t1 [Chlamydomonas eustigma]|uniref:Molybdopterin cofactor biosynthesis C (MoaC) domain-containing protein n=1 Tax=Chlamydomonas eustigma TaxID=1157962 RepID=A0A250WV80_9CHLO|nr:hypothetical protein CEUSTIGMA_g2175.t1 [Chlamydomonas eustigma]|eukprot:GAX74728.1 hypothetical protein CEUSTIGMA_g2175.t1 [Chlamydomonas eustigma]
MSYLVSCLVPLRSSGRQFLVTVSDSSLSNYTRKLYSRNFSSLVDVDEVNKELSWHFLVEEDEVKEKICTVSDVKDSPQNPSLDAQTDDLKMRTDSQLGLHELQSCGKSQAKLTHVDPASGRARMVDVSEKPLKKRSAVARAVIKFQDSNSLPHKFPKASVFKNIQQSAFLAAQLAGIKAAKMTSLLIPLCHNINLSKIHIDFVAPEEQHDEVHVLATATALGQTGVEMEALSAATFSALCLLLNQGSSVMQGRVEGALKEILLLSKFGGESGHYDISSSSILQQDPELSPHQRQGLEDDPHHSDSSITQSSVLSSGALALGSCLTASVRLRMPILTWRQLIDNVNKKGDVLEISRLAGMMSINHSPALLQGFCLTRDTNCQNIKVQIQAEEEGIVKITADAAPAQESTAGNLMTAASVTALTVYDMCKASSKSIRIEGLGITETGASRK